MQMRMNNEIDQEYFTKYKTELDKEKLILKSELNDNTDKVESWFTKVSNALDFAKTACDEFRIAIENKDNQKKKEILASLGYNHLLFDKKLILQPIKEFIAVEKLSEVSSSVFEGLEPIKTITAQRQNGQSNETSSLMWRWAESNRRANDYYQNFYKVYLFYYRRNGFKIINYKITKYL